MLGASAASLRPALADYAPRGIAHIVSGLWRGRREHKSWSASLRRGLESAVSHFLAYHAGRRDGERALVRTAARRAAIAMSDRLALGAHDEGMLVNVGGLAYQRRRNSGR